MITVPYSHCLLAFLHWLNIWSLLNWQRMFIALRMLCQSFLKIDCKHSLFCSGWGSCVDPQNWSHIAPLPPLPHKAQRLPVVRWGTSGEKSQGCSWEFSARMCQPQSLTIFQTQKCHFSHLLSDLASKKLCLLTVNKTFRENPAGLE